MQLRLKSGKQISFITLYINNSYIQAQFKSLKPEPKVDQISLGLLNSNLKTKKAQAQIWFLCRLELAQTQFAPLGI